MESVRCVPSLGSNCRAGGTGRHTRALLLMFAVLFVTAKLSSQPAAGAISTHPLALPASLIDAAGNVYTAGSGYATPSYPVTPGAAQTQPSGLCPTFFALGRCSTAYVAKSDANGNLVFGTFLGGQTDDSANAVAVDAAGNVYIVGETGGSLPTTANAAIASSTTSQVFAAKISADGSIFLYVTYLPNTDATGLAIAVDGEGNAYLAGETTTDHAFIAKLNAAGSAYLYNVTLPGTQVESATGIVVDSNRNAVAVGWTQAQSGGAQNVFVSKVDATGPGSQHHSRWKRNGSSERRSIGCRRKHIRGWPDYVFGFPDDAGQFPAKSTDTDVGFVAGWIHLQTRREQYRARIFELCSESRHPV